ncbi:hypothetical protein VTK73DRAFT_3856 [Phialemonium thermophilum]|uniref:Uncharacterized protein n=1 Tax=Phialemonium thermophilum TaxID=223376 RepID=A0ABR3VDX9_9PEZI
MKSEQRAKKGEEKKKGGGKKKLVRTRVGKAVAYENRSNESSIVCVQESRRTCLWGLMDPRDSSDAVCPVASMRATVPPTVTLFPSPRFSASVPQRSPGPRCHSSPPDSPPLAVSSNPSQPVGYLCSCRISIQLGLEVGEARRASPQELDASLGRCWRLRGSTLLLGSIGRSQTLQAHRHLIDPWWVKPLYAAGPDRPTATER